MMKATEKRDEARVSIMIDTIGTMSISATYSVASIIASERGYLNVL